MEKKGVYENTRGASEKFSEVTPSRILESALLKCSINIFHH